MRSGPPSQRPSTRPLKRSPWTWLCSVVFIDIAGYTEHPVTGQINLKGRLQSLIEQIITVTPEGERVIVDTGDGAALCCLGDPE